MLFLRKVTETDLPQLGDTTIRGKSYCKWVWHACVDCGKERWVFLLHGNPLNLRCTKCAAKERTKERYGPLHHAWGGGRRKTRYGYVRVWVSADDFFFPMCHEKRMHGGYVMEHRLVMAKSLGRNLHLWEIVHHKNGVKDDNRIENLRLISIDGHLQLTKLETMIHQKERKIKELMEEIDFLKKGK